MILGKYRERIIDKQRLDVHDENRKEKSFMTKTVTPRISWRVRELPEATGLGVPFWRKVISQKKIRVRKPAGGAIVILDEDLRAFLAGEEKEEAHSGEESFAASVPAGARTAQ
jgi:hypothetical protein